MRSKTEQELFWEGQFGNDYTQRNDVLWEQRQPFFATVLSKTFGVKTICELGANRGHNLEAIAHLSSNFELTGVELNPSALASLKAIPTVNAVHSSIQEFQPNQTFDLVFTCGVLIHINPDDLPLVYQKIFDLSSRYILINEYFNPAPVELSYRGHSEKLFKRDFAKEFIDQTQHVSVVDYGFLWQQVNPSWDNTTWFLMEKTAE
ncbi:MAG: methyltransferase domain-containing protein [Oculatellaceae cyanobacterium bins.114]|nr:methyltransferase domain-containing protein [Oculatellaceae cyanobacterium bins.114]